MNEPRLTVTEHLKEVVACPNVRRCLIEGHTDHPCYRLVTDQHIDNPTQFQVPEPWNGNLATARLLFLSSNPSINFSEHYPRGIVSSDGQFLGSDGWHEPAHIIAFFQTRFELGSNQMGGKTNKFWATVRARASELLDDVELGRDVVITEVVRCKSKHEKAGVIKAAESCVPLYLDKTLSLSRAKVMICMGQIAVDIFRNRYLPEIPSDAHTVGFIHGPAQIQQFGQSERYFIFMPHATGAFGPRTFAKLFATGKSALKFKELRAALAVH